MINNYKEHKVQENGTSSNPRDDVMESLLNGTWWDQHGGRKR